MSSILMSVCFVLSKYDLSEKRLIKCYAGARMWALCPQITSNVKIHPLARMELTKFCAFVHGIYVKFFSEGTKTGNFALVCVKNRGI